MSEQKTYRLVIDGAAQEYPAGTSYETIAAGYQAQGAVALGYYAEGAVAIGKFVKGSVEIVLFK